MLVVNIRIGLDWASEHAPMSNSAIGMFCCTKLYHYI